MNRFAITAVLFLFTAIACTRQAPQLPSNKATEMDSSAVSLQLVNEKLILGEDSILANFVKKSGIDFKKSNSGLWYKTSMANNKNNKPIQGESCEIDYKVYSLQNKLLFNETKTLVIGKKQIINGVEEVLLNLSKNDSAIAIIPWYIGYGIKGNEYIPPYNSVLVYIKRLK